MYRRFLYSSKSTLNIETLSLHTSASHDPVQTVFTILDTDELQKQKMISATTV